MSTNPNPMWRTVLWTAVEQSMPDSDTTVLIHAPTSSEPVWLGFHDGEHWREVSGDIVEGVRHWADLPLGPEPL